MIDFDTNLFGQLLQGSVMIEIGTRHMKSAKWFRALDPLVTKFGRFLIIRWVWKDKRVSVNDKDWVGVLPTQMFLNSNLVNPDNFVQFCPSIQK